MTVGCVLSALVLAIRFGRDVWLGMLAPLLVVGITWIVTERVYRATPERLTAVMIGGFAGKLVFFGAYVGLVPFAVSFTGYFVALHLVEALWLKRLFVS